MSSTRRSVRLNPNGADHGLQNQNTGNMRNNGEPKDALEEKHGPGVPSKPKKKRGAPKKAGATSSSKRSRAAKLSSLPEMPLDILFELFSHLLPLDLLRLARATKPLRQILMNRSSAFVWIRARANLPGASFPDCPPGLSEPALASLAFDTHCQFCGVNGANRLRVHWTLFTRTCKSCEVTEFSSCYLPGSLNEICNNLGIAPEKALTDMDCLPLVSGWTYAKKQLPSVLLEYATIEDEAEREKWKGAKKAEMQIRKKFATAAEEWWWDWKEQRRTDIQSVKEGRSAAILERLKREGYADIIDRFHEDDKAEFHNHKLVKQNKDLTDRIWKNVKDEMASLFDTFRARQCDRDQVEVRVHRFKTYIEAYNNFCATLPADTVLAPMVKIFLMDSIQIIWDNEDLDFTPDVSDFVTALSDALEFSAEWKAEFDMHLCCELEPEDGLTNPGDQDESILHLATSLFTCQACDECHLTYEQIFSHRCSSLYAMVIDDIPLYAQYSIFPHRDQMRKLLKLCNLPHDTTMAGFKQINPLIECCDVRCMHGGLIHHAMFWYEFLSHSEGLYGPFRALSYEDQLQIRTHVHLTPMIVKAFAALQFIYGCRHCYIPRGLSFEGLQEHLLTRHDITIQTRESMEHYIIHPGAIDLGRVYGVMLYI